VEFRRFLDTIEAAVPADLEIHLILDNYATHKTPAIRAAGEAARYTCISPRSARQWINSVERWFALLTRSSSAGRAP